MVMLAPVRGGSDRVGAGGSQDARREAESNGDEAEQEEDDDDDEHGDSEGRAMAGSAMAGLCAGSRRNAVGWGEGERDVAAAEMNGVN